MYQTKFKIPKMDCPSEERMIRMTLDGNDSIKNMTFNFSDRSLVVLHSTEPESILKSLEPLNYGAILEESKVYSENFDELEESLNPEKEANVLKILLGINGFMFIVEIIFGLLAESMGLISDSLDMLADAAVYGMSLYAVGKARELKKRAAKFSGYLQLVLAISVLFETGRRFLFGSEPESLFMISIASFALVANVSCLILLLKHRDREVHMKASWIFSTNDVIANVGVIVAGVLVFFLKSPYPDLIVGAIVGSVVFRGAILILKLAR